jgi:hypothetical protein
MSMKTSREVRFCSSCFSLSISAPLRPMMMPGRAVLMMMLDLDRADACRLQLVLQLSLQLHVFEQQLVVIPLDKPARLPRLGIAKPESVWMDFLTHRSSFETWTCHWSTSLVVFRPIVVVLAGDERLTTISLRLPSSCSQPPS